jgi:putative membrane protein
LTRSSTLERNVQTAARGAFYDLGIARTSGRNGILVFVSVFERECVVLPDIGVDPTVFGSAYQNVVDGLRQAIRRRRVPAFRQALESLGPLLGAQMPRAADDVNELPDEVR